RRANATETRSTSMWPGRSSGGFNSMEPSRERDGDVVSAIGFLYVLIASMEPSRERDGDPLQPGRHWPNAPQLQWSRRANATETLLRCRQCDLPNRFNGAVARTRRRRGRGGGWVATKDGFNGAVARTRRRR